MSDNDQSIYTLRYNQIAKELEGFGGGSPMWTPLSLSMSGGITQLTGDVIAGPGSGSQASTVVSVGGSSASNIHSAELLTNASTTANTHNTLVKRDGVTGGFSAGFISVTGVVSTGLIESSTFVNPNNGTMTFLPGNDTATAFEFFNSNQTNPPVLDIDTLHARVGINTATPSVALDISGTANATAITTAAFKLSTSPTNGYVLTSDASGNGTWAAASGGSGKLLQNLFASTTTETDTTGSTWAPTSLSQTITCHSSSNYVIMQILATIDTFAAGNTAYITVFRDSTNIGDTTNGVIQYSIESGNSRFIGGTGLTVYDNPGDTSAHTYTVNISAPPGQTVRFCFAGMALMVTQEVQP